MDQLNTSAIVAAIIISALGGSGLVGMFFWMVKNTITRNQQALDATLQRIEQRQDEHGKRLHDLETAKLVTTRDLEARLGPLDGQLRDMGTQVATMNGHLKGMAAMAKNMLTQGG